MFDYYSDLIFIFQYDILLQKKFKNLANLLNKDDWVIFLEGNIFMINSKNDKALQRYNDIISSSTNKKLQNYAKEKKEIISDE